MKRNFFEDLQEENLLQHYESQLIFKAEQLFSKELTTLRANREGQKLPLFKYFVPEYAPSALSLNLLSNTSQKVRMPTFLEEMVSHWLGKGDKLEILSSQNVTFDHYYFVEILVHVKNLNQLRLIKNNLPHFANQIKRGTLFHLFARHLLQTKRLALGKKSSMIYQTASFLANRFPKRFDADFFSYLEQFLLTIKQEFQQKRSVHHLCRLISARYLFEKALTQENRNFSARRTLYIKLLPTKLKYPFGTKQVLGVLVCLNGLGEYESFSHRHILRTIQHFTPHVDGQKSSYYSYRDDQKKLLTLYLEIEKKEGSPFTIELMQELRQRLPIELKNSIEYLSPSLFIPRNEEELVRNIITLSNELKYVRDLPQAIITFQEQRKEILKFNVVLVRIKHKETIPFQKSSEQLPSQVRFIFDRVNNVGFIRKKHIKEANIFSLEVNNTLFLRKNHSVDLVKARSYVANAIEKMIGPFRDYNGGFLLKQNEQLEMIKSMIPEYSTMNDYLFENLFYALSPSMIQASLPKDKGKLLFSLFLATYLKNFSKEEDFFLSTSEQAQSFAVVIKAHHQAITQRILDHVQEVPLIHQGLTHASLEIDEHHYLCFLLMNNSIEERDQIMDLINRGINDWKCEKQESQTLRLHIPRPIKAVDPRIATDRTSGVVIHMLYEGLMREDLNKNLEPAIAKGVIISPDKLRYTFTLRKSYWSNGAPVTAHDFVYAWKTVLDPQFFASYAFLFFFIRNAQRAKKGLVSLEEVGITAPNDETLIVDLEHPAPYFLELTANWIFSPLWRMIDKTYPGWAYSNNVPHIYNGPFKLDYWKPNNEMQFVKNINYWDIASVKLDKIELNVIEDEMTAIEMFLRGKLDWAGDPLSKIPLKKISKLTNEERLCTDCVDGVFWIQLDIHSIPFHTPKLRKSFAYAINRKYLIEKVFQSEDRVACGFFADIHKPCFQDGDERAASLLFQEALLEANLSLADLSPIKITHSEIEEHEALALAIGKMWQELFGVQIEYERVLWNAFFDVLNRGDYQVGGLVWYRRHSDPIYLFELFLEREHGAKVTNWKDSQFIELVQKAKRIESASEKERLLLKAESILLDQMPVIPICFQHLRYVKNPRLKNYIISNPELINFRRAYLEIDNEKT